MFQEMLEKFCESYVEAVSSRAMKKQITSPPKKALPGEGLPRRITQSDLSRGADALQRPRPLPRVEPLSTPILTMQREGESPCCQPIIREDTKPQDQVQTSIEEDGMRRKRSLRARHMQQAVVWKEILDAPISLRGVSWIREV